MGLAAVVAGLCGGLAGLAAAVMLLARLLGPVPAAAALSGVLLAGALSLWLALWARRRRRAPPVLPMPAQGNPSAEPAVFASFLIGFLLARRFINPR